MTGLMGLNAEALCGAESWDDTVSKEFFSPLVLLTVLGQDSAGNQAVEGQTSKATIGLDFSMILKNEIFIC